MGSVRPVLRGTSCRMCFVSLLLVIACNWWRMIWQPVGNVKRGFTSTLSHYCASQRLPFVFSTTTIRTNASSAPQILIYFPPTFNLPHAFKKINTAWVWIKWLIVLSVVMVIYLIIIYVFFMTPIVPGMKIEFVWKCSRRQKSILLCLLSLLLIKLHI